MSPRETGVSASAETPWVLPLINHGGPVLSTPTSYLIWYGNWDQDNGSDTPAGQALVRIFLRGIGNTPFFLINSADAGYAGVTGGARLGWSEVTVSTTDSSQVLTYPAIQSIVMDAIDSGKLGPADPNGVYFVLTSSNINQSGFCSLYCGYHTYLDINGTRVQYAFVGNANRCLNTCAPQTVGPNDNAGVDGMISIIGHELAGATTNPHLNGWFDQDGKENADKCAWTFGASLTLLPNGAYYNMTVGGKNYLVQRNMQANDNKCYVGFNGQQ